MSICMPSMFILTAIAWHIHIAAAFARLQLKVSLRGCGRTAMDGTIQIEYAFAYEALLDGQHIVHCTT